MGTLDIVVESNEILLVVIWSIFGLPKYHPWFIAMSFPVPLDLGVAYLIASGRIPESEAYFQLGTTKGIPINQRPFLMLI